MEVELLLFIYLGNDSVGLGFVVVEGWYFLFGSFLGFWFVLGKGKGRGEYRGRGG